MRVMDMVGSRNLALNFDLARPGVKTWPYGGTGNCNGATWGGSEKREGLFCVSVGRARRIKTIPLLGIIWVALFFVGF